MRYPDLVSTLVAAVHRMLEEMDASPDQRRQAEAHLSGILDVLVQDVLVP